MKQMEKIGGLLIHESPQRNRTWETIEGPVIVLSIEELKELWDAAHSRGENIKEVRKNIPDFKTYLSSRGINL